MAETLNVSSIVFYRLGPPQDVMAGDDEKNRGQSKLNDGYSPFKLGMALKKYGGFGSLVGRARDFW